MKKELNEDLIQLSLYYGFSIDVTNCFRGNEKGTVENEGNKMLYSALGNKPILSTRLPSRTPEVKAKIYADKIVVYANDKVARHKKIEGSHGFCLDIYHYIKTFKRKPGALRRSQVLKQNPELETLYKYYNPEVLRRIHRLPWKKSKTKHR